MRFSEDKLKVVREGLSKGETLEGVLSGMGIDKDVTIKKYRIKLEGEGIDCGEPIEVKPASVAESAVVSQVFKIKDVDGKLRDIKPINSVSSKVVIFA